jgi:hypothetical protein
MFVPPLQNLFSVTLLHHVNVVPLSYVFYSFTLFYFTYISIIIIVLLGIYQPQILFTIYLAMIDMEINYCLSSTTLKYLQQPYHPSFFKI